MLFTDMEGSTETSRARGDAVAMDLLRVHETLVRKAATAHDGYVVKSTGDGYLVAFPTSFDAAAAALEVRNALDDHNRSRSDDRVLVRFGIHAGPTIAESGDLYGLAVNTCARVTAKAMTGQVLVSEEVRGELGEATGWMFLDRGLFWLKGLREQWRLYEVTDRAPVEPVVQVAGRLPFVDRDAERATLRRHVDAANDGHGSLVFVPGASGAGKTRLVEEIGAEAQARGLQFVAGRCYEAATGKAYAPVVEISTAIEARLTPDALRDVLGDGAAEISRVLPDIRDQWPDIPPLPEWPVQETRNSLFVAVRDAVGRFAATRPLVVLIDDVHWADEASLRLLEYLAAELRSLPVVVFATYCEEEVSATPFFRPFLSKLHRRRAVDSVHVPPLGEGHVGELLATLADRPPPRTLVLFLHDATGGNPFYLEEVVRHLLDNGLLLDDQRDWRRDIEALELEVPDSVRFAIDGRLDHLSTETRGVLTTAAVIGRDFGFELLEDLARDDLDEDRLLDALDEGERARLILASNDAGRVRFAFAHGLIQRTLAGEISLTRRQRVHLRIADALERVYADTIVEHAADIAFHLTNAGRRAEPDRTARFLLLAGDRALGSSAFEEALRHFDRGLAMLPAVSGSERARVLEKMGLAERSLGHLDDALALWEEALALHDAEGARHEVARLCLNAAIQVAWWRRGADVMTLVGRGIEALGDDDSALRGGLLALAGGIASQAGSYDQASQLLDDALTIARRHGDDGMLGLALYSLAVHHFGYMQYENVVTTGRASMEHLRRAGDLWNLANVQGYVGASLGWLGRIDEADELGADAGPFAKRLGNWSAWVFADSARAFRDVGTQPASEVLAARGDEALQLGRDLGFAWLTSIGHGRLGLAAFWSGRWDEALDHLEEAARAEQRISSGGHLGRLFLLHAYLGHRGIALDLIAQATPQLPVVGRPNSGTSWTLGLAALEALAVLGERHRAAALYPTVVDYAATGAIMRSWDYRLVSTLAGIAAGCDAEWEQAEAHFTHARRTAASLPMRLEEPDVLRFHASMLLTRRAAGDVERAQSMLSEAATLYDDLGMMRHAELARSMR